MHPLAEKISKLPMEEKHELASLMFSMWLRKQKKYLEMVAFLRAEMIRVRNEEEQEHGYTGSEYFATKRILTLIYGA